MAFKFHIRLILALLGAFVVPIAAANAEPYKIVGFGDSLMAGYGLDPGESFPEKLEKALREKGHDVVIVNAGVSGDTSSGGLSRLDWSIPDGTQLVILELGANDMLRGIPPDVTEKNLRAMLSRLKERRIPVLLAGMLAAPNLGSEYQAAFNGIYPKLAEEFGVPLYPFFLDGLVTDPSVQLPDRLHPNAKGVDRIVERILPTVEKAMAANPDNS